ncbi:hypothetical protein PSV08DRAFT_355240 [Bipolaris maydis]|uniref:uncharacterized protein n=1 Tax=Cochliobolus heterostrophus TaxID=5016 RepID=UPI0024CF40E7|nr:hypothetical protein PSV08DRAFT_354936 [Bipolaris maydis]KAJ6267690.1 hypothetical protein PSV08DRAFT_355240 [Bipolaris maydis]
MSDITGEEHELPGSDETLIDYVTPVDLVMPSAGVDWDGSSTTACSAYSETAEGPAQESQLEAPHWVKQPSLR